MAHFVVVVVVLKIQTLIYFILTLVFTRFLFVPSLKP